MIFDTFYGNMTFILRYILFSIFNNFILDFSFFTKSKQLFLLHGRLFLNPWPIHASRISLAVFSVIIMVCTF